MTVQELVAKLQTTPPDLPVCIADWNEGYRQPSELQLEEVATITAAYGDGCHGSFVCLGEYS